MTTKSFSPGLQPYEYDPFDNPQQWNAYQKFGERERWHLCGETLKQKNVISFPVKPDRKLIATFVTAVFKYATAGNYVSLTFPDKGSNKDMPFKITPVKLNGDLDALIDKALRDAELAAKDKDKIVFCPPIATFSNSQHAREEDLAEGLALSIECDKDAQQARAKLVHLLGPATAVVESGGLWITDSGEQKPKLHTHHRLKIPARDEVALKKLKLLRRLATELVGGDASNITAVHPIRWPGSVHRKGEPKLCRIVSLNPDAEIDLDAALAILQKASGKTNTDASNEATNPFMEISERWEKETKPWTAKNEERVRSMLSAIPANCYRPQWVMIGMTLHWLHWIADDGTDWGLQAWDTWSKTSAGDGPGEQGGRYRGFSDLKKCWKSFGKYDGPQVTIARLYKIATEHGWTETQSESVSQPTPQLKRFVIIRASEIKMRPKEWLWTGHLLRGALELLTGQPGLGKSQVQIHYMACVTAGLTWPDGTVAIEPANVIMVTAEDALETEVAPRLQAAGCNMDRVHILKAIKTDKLQRQFLLAEDLAGLDQLTKEIGDAALICIDPITAYMGGKVDSHKATEVRSQLGPLKDFSESSNVAMSAITHPAKNASARAIDHFIGSQAFVAAARIGHACFEEFDVDEETGEKTPTGRILFTNVKHNPHQKMATLAFKVETVFINPKPFMQIETSRVVWDKDMVHVTAEQAIATARSVMKNAAKKEEASSEVVNFLRSMIDTGGGWCAQTEIATQAKALGYSDKEVRTAREKLAITSKREGGIGKDGRWLWGWEGKRPIRF